MENFDVSKDEELLKLKSLSKEEVSNIINQISIEDLEAMMKLLNGGEDNE